MLPLSLPKTLLKEYNQSVESRMARLKLINDAKCWRCNQTTGTMTHMLYECDKVVVFWDKLIAFLNKLLNLAWHKNPGLCMLGIFQKDDLMNKLYGELVDSSHGSTARKGRPMLLVK
uniref:Reverse transcriptase zinc-binding domain-containing protein n=1 Tax=Neogobius melanostomus TaxID=47308 RepID=A0A8C6SJJ9_9GOBI